MVASKYRTSIIDHVDDHGIGEIVANQSGTTWAAEAADDDLIEVVADTRFGTTQCIKIVDESNTNQGSVTKTIPISACIGDEITFPCYPVTAFLAGSATNPLSYVLIAFREDANDRVLLLVDLATGNVMYSNTARASWAATGLTLTLDAVNSNVTLSITNATTSTIRLGNGTAYAVPHDGTISSAINKIEITTPAAHGYEGFESYAVGAATPKNTAYWNNWNANGGGDLETVAGQRGYLSRTGAWTTWPLYTLSTAQADAAVGSYGFTVRFAAWPAASAQINALSAAASTQTHWYVTSAGMLQVLNNLTTTNVVQLALDTDYTILIECITTSTYYIWVNGTRYGAYTKYSARTAAIASLQFSLGGNGGMYIDDIVTSWATAAPDVDSIECYIGDILLREHASSDSLQVMQWQLDHEESGLILAACLPLQQADGSILTAVSDTNDNTIDVYRVTTTSDAYDTWTKVIDTGSTEGRFIGAAPSDGTVYAIYKNSGGASYIAKTADYGVTWTINASTSLMIIDVFCLGTTVYLIDLEAAANNLYNVYELTDDTPTLVKRATYDSGVNTGYRDFTHGVATSATVYLGMLHCNVFAQGYNRLLKFDSGAATLTLYDQHASSTGSSATSRRLALIVDPDTSIVHGTSGIIIAPAGSATSQYYITYSEDGGDDWSELATGVHVATPEGAHIAGQERIIIDVEELQAFVYDTYRDAMQRIISPDWGGYTTTINVAGSVVLCSGASGTRVFERVLGDASWFTDVQLFSNIVSSARLANHCDFKIKSDYAYAYAIGDTIEFYDSYGALWFRGRITSNRVARNTCTYTAHDSTRELARPPATADMDEKMSTFISNQVGTLASGYAGTFEDVDYNGGPFHYHTSINRTLQPGFRLFRAIERSIVYVTANGEWNSAAHDHLPASGYRWLNHDALKLKLVGNEVETIDVRATRASVMRAGNARDSYIGDAAREVIEGVVAAGEHRDLAIQDSGDAVNLAEQLYAIFSQETTFVHVLVMNHGYIQPGQTVDFSWSLGETEVARATMAVIAVHAYMLHDIQEVVLSNNIVLEAEMDNLELLDDE
jgi:hypothetical protein